MQGRVSEQVTFEIRREKGNQESTLGREKPGDVPLVTEHSIDNYSLPFAQLRVSLLTAIFRAKKFL